MPDWIRKQGTKTLTRSQRARRAHQAGTKTVEIRDKRGTLVWTPEVQKTYGTKAAYHAAREKPAQKPLERAEAKISIPESGAPPQKKLEAAPYTEKDITPTPTRTERAKAAIGRVARSPMPQWQVGHEVSTRFKDSLSGEYQKMEDFRTKYSAGAKTREQQLIRERRVDIMAGLFKGGTGFLYTPAALMSVTPAQAIRAGKGAVLDPFGTAKAAAGSAAAMSAYYHERPGELFGSALGLLAVGGAYKAGAAARPAPQHYAIKAQGGISKRHMKIDAGKFKITETERIPVRISRTDKPPTPTTVERAVLQRSHRYTAETGKHGLLVETRTSFFKEPAKGKYADFMKTHGQVSERLRQPTPPKAKSGFIAQEFTKNGGSKKIISDVTRDLKKWETTLTRKSKVKGGLAADKTASARKLDQELFVFKEIEPKLPVVAKRVGKKLPKPPKPAIKTATGKPITPKQAPPHVQAKQMPRPPTIKEFGEFYNTVGGKKLILADRRAFAATYDVTPSDFSGGLNEHVIGGFTLGGEAPRMSLPPVVLTLETKQEPAQIVQVIPALKTATAPRGKTGRRPQAKLKDRPYTTRRLPAPPKPIFFPGTRGSTKIAERQIPVPLPVEIPKIIPLSAQISKHAQKAARPPPARLAPATYHVPRKPTSRTLFRFGLPSSKKTAVASPLLFRVFARVRGKDLLLRQRQTLRVAKRDLSLFLKRTLAASGTIRYGGRKLKFRLGAGFRPSKLDPFRIVQRRELRLGTRPEREQIQKSRKRLRWRRKR